MAALPSEQGGHVNHCNCRHAELRLVSRQKITIVLFSRIEVGALLKIGLITKEIDNFNYKE